MLTAAILTFKDMNTYIKNKIALGFLGLMTATLIISCSKMDDYKKFTEKGEISYTGKLDSVKVFSGRNRVLIKGLLLADPKVVSLRIFWNNMADSLVIPVTKKSPVDSVSVLVDKLTEGVQNFVIYTYDNAGNKSIPVFKTGRSYGARYQASLFNRPIDAAFTDAKGITRVSWLGMDRLTGVYATELEYTDKTDKLVTLKAPIDSTSTFLKNFKPGSSLRYRTLFLPDTSTIDIFSTDFQNQRVGADLTATYFKNAGPPMLAAGGSGRWRNIADWISTPNIRNHGGAGGWCSDQGGCLAMEMGWDGTAKIVDGKIYQTFTLPAGTYNFTIDLAVNEAKDPVYIVAAEGDVLPNVDQVATSLAYTNFANKTIQFTLTQQKKVSIGFLATMVTGNQFWIVKSINFKSQ
jgi:hypothetical protein